MHQVSLLHTTEKSVFLDFAKENLKLGCRKLADIYKIGKTVAANILKNEKKIHEQHEMFCEKSKNRNLLGKYHKINEILFTMLDKIKQFLSLIMIAKVCCLRLRKGLRTFN